MKLKSLKTKKKLTWYSFTLVSLGFIGYEYYKNCSDVPITNRKHFAVFYFLFNINRLSQDIMS